MTTTDQSSSGPSQDELIGYDQLDAFKRQAVDLGRSTTRNLESTGVTEVEWSRGESCFVLDHGSFYSGHVTEGLGTFNMAFEEMQRTLKAYDGREMPRGYARFIGHGTVGAISNDMATLGIPMMTMGMHAAVGDSAYFDDKERTAEILEGWSIGVNESGAVWGCGETPTLAGMIAPDTIEMSGFGFGILHDRDMLVNPANIRPGDVIIGLASEGIQVNGLSKARLLAQEAGGYFGPDRYGEELMAPSLIAMKYLRACQKAQLRWSYAINVSGHGWRKIMRPFQPFTYRITNLPNPQRIFDLIAQRGNISVREMYATFNMGVFFIVIVRLEDEKDSMGLAQMSGYTPIRLGTVEEGPKRVIIEPIDETYEADELQVR